MSAKRKNAVRILMGIAVVLLAFIYFSPIWWVALKAPNYPAEAFPDGVRIHFHMNGTFNGCTLQVDREVEEDEALDCVHEMDAINHFVGMYPIASGGVVEKAFSPFLLSLLAVMLIGFTIDRRTLRLGAMGLGFAAIATWMYMAYHGPGGIHYQPESYVSSLVTSLGQGKEEEGEPLSPIIAELREELQANGEVETRSSEELHDSLKKSGQSSLSAVIANLHEGSGASDKSLSNILAEAKQTGKKGHALNIPILKGAYDADQLKLSVGQREEWNGSVKQVIFWHYSKALGRWFNNPEEIKPLVSLMKTIGILLFWSIIAGMVALLAVAWNNRGPLFWFLAIIPAMLPVFFIAEYAGWLWWYGHSMNAMGAFSLKAFMPTVFGQGKVAQFTTLSYPHYGYGLIIVFSIVTILAILIRRKGLRDAD
ncbi:MAG: hypothetical protein GY761_10170 [Hyphomicrobiales bacterium]|nr:hypothetical protein [Hyphomicrobiales bacterium]